MLLAKKQIAYRAWYQLPVEGRAATIRSRAKGMKNSTGNDEKTVQILALPPNVQPTQFIQLK